MLLATASSVFAAQNTPQKDSSTLIIQLENVADKQSTIDSVYIIFDRYDRRGAGVIRQVYYPEKNHIRLVIPKGKYFVNVYCLGIYHHECFDRIVNAHGSKRQKLKLRLETSALYTPGFVNIPQEKIDPSRLSILRFASQR